MMFLLVRLSWGSLYSVYLSSTLSMSVDAYWYSLLLLLKMMSAISQSHSTLSSYAFFITPNLRLLKVTCQHQPMRENYTTTLLNRLVLNFSLLNEESRQKSWLWPTWYYRIHSVILRFIFQKDHLQKFEETESMHELVLKRRRCPLCVKVRALHWNLKLILVFHNHDINNSQHSYNTLD